MSSWSSVCISIKPGYCAAGCRCTRRFIPRPPGRLPRRSARPGIGELAFDRCEERLGRRGVPALALAAHRQGDLAFPRRRGRPQRPDRVRPRPDRPDHAAGARRIASVVPDSMLAIRFMTTVLSVTCRTTPSSWGRTGGHGSADPGPGMNRAPDRLYLAVRLSCVRVGCGLAGERRCVLPLRTWRSRARNRPTLMAGDLLVRQPEIDSYGSHNLGKPARGVRMSEV